MDIVCKHCGAFHWKAEKLSTSTRIDIKFGMCCFEGKVSLPRLDALPQELHNLYHDNDRQAKAFRDNIRQYNSALAMTSVGQDAGRQLHIDRTVNDGNGPWVYKLHGACHHITGSLLPPEGRQPSYAQLYIWDPEQALDIRMNNRANAALDRRTMQSLQDMLYRKHPSIALYKQAIELTANLDPAQDCRILLRFDKNCDKRRYNLPGAANREIAVIIPGEGDASLEPRDIILHRKGGGLRRINEMSPAYQALHYVLLFPTGQLGWHKDLPRGAGDGAHDSDSDQQRNQVVAVRGKRKTISQREYFIYRLHPRQNESNHIFKAEKLLQEYMVDSWASSEQYRLNWFRHNQKTIRSELYADLAHAVQENPNLDGQQRGQRVILPSSFTGSTRAMVQNLQDALAINRHFGGADLFLTMTADPNWPEIQRELLPGQTAADRPDLVSRVFKMKQAQLLEDIFHRNILGAAVGRVWTIEFQKRGLPHCHMIIFFKREHKLRTPDDVDTLISAELPDKDTQPELFALVTKHMVHGPCGALNPNSPCMVDGKCSKNFPKQFNDFTTVAEDSYATYRRRDDGRKHMVRGKEVDNRWIVPYCPYLLFRYRCHLNLESVFSIKSIKYIYKYVYKGHDRTTMQFGRSQDEVQLYLDARYVCSNEAYWRLAGFKTHEEVPSVYRLEVHLPQEQRVTYDPNAQPNMQEVVAQAANRDTTLTGYFKANQSFEIARDTLY